MKRLPSITSLPYQRIPHLPGVFLAYQARLPQALSLYRHPPEPEALARAAEEALQGVCPRQEMAAILKSQNEAFGGDDSSRHSIENLAKSDCAAVLTGQQVGLFTGPMLTIHKALTAIRLSEELRHRGFNSVPIFWMASDDHDLAEVTRLAIPGAGAETRALDTRHQLFGTTEMPPHPVGAIRLPETIRQVVGTYAASLAGFEWSIPVEKQLASACRPGTTFTECFGRVMAQLFRKRGLILFDPRDSRSKKLAAPAIRKALRAAQTLRAQLTDRNRTLQDSGYETQVAVLARSTLVFFEDEGERRLLLTGNGEFTLKETGKRFAADEMLDRVENAPECFSPNVLLRPLIQDLLFPTAAYVGGPAEVSYFAQVEPVYRFFGRPMPLIWPRSSFTVLDAETCGALARHGLTLEDCFLGERHIFRILLQAQPLSFEVLLSQLASRLDQGINDVKPALALAESSLGPAADTVRRKIRHRVASLQTKYLNFEIRQNRGLREKALRLLNNCCPNGHMQERELGIHCLLARFGPSLLDTLYAAIDVDTFAHQIVCL